MERLRARSFVSAFEIDLKLADRLPSRSNRPPIPRNISHRAELFLGERKKKAEACIIRILRALEAPSFGLKIGSEIGFDFEGISLFRAAFPLHISSYRRHPWYEVDVSVIRKIRFSCVSNVIGRPSYRRSCTVHYYAGDVLGSKKKNFSHFQ